MAPAAKSAKRAASASSPAKVKSTAAVASPGRAAADAEEPAKKMARRHGVSASMFDAIVEIVEHPFVADQLPSETRKMLTAMVPYGLCVASDERHEFQTHGVRMIEEVATKIEERMKSEVSTEQAALESFEASKKELESGIESTTAHVTAAQEVVDSSKTALNDASAALLHAKAKHAELQDAQRKGDASYVAIKDDKIAFEAVLNGAFVKLKDGEYEPGTAKTLYSPIAPLVGKLSIDESLVLAIPSAMQKKPSERGAFDHMVLTTFEQDMHKKVAELGSALLAEGPGAAERAALVDEAHADYQAKHAAHLEAAVDLSSKKQAHLERVTADKEARAKLAAYEPEYKKATKVRDAKQEQLKCFQERNLAVFSQLRDKVAVKAAASVIEEPLCSAGA